MSKQESSSKVFYYINDLPNSVEFESKNSVAIDTETMGLKNVRDRLCVIQLSFGDNIAYVIHLQDQSYSSSPNLMRLLANPERQKIFHFARFDMAVIKIYLKVNIQNIYCTKIASKFVRTYAQSHGLKDLCFDLAEAKISKQQRLSDWGAETLTKEQIQYAANDVLYLHQIQSKLDILLRRENRMEMAQQCFKFLPTKVELDILGWEEDYIFAH